MRHILVILLTLSAINLSFANTEIQYTYDNSSIVFEKGSQKVFSFSLKNLKAVKLLETLRIYLEDELGPLEFEQMTNRGIYRLDFALGDSLQNNASMECFEEVQVCKVYLINKSLGKLTRGTFEGAIFQVGNDKIWTYKAYLSIDNPTMLDLFNDADIFFNCEFLGNHNTREVCWLVLM